MSSIAPSSPFPRPGSSLAAALALVPVRRRAASAIWLNWWHEVSAIPYAVSDPGVAETKLRWWQQQVHGAAQHARAEHPLLKAWLALPLEERGLQDWSLWLGQIDALLGLLQQTRWLDQATMLRHIDGSTGRACEGAALVLGASDTDATRAAGRQIGRGLRLAHQLARLGQDARAGWVHVPIDTLQAHAVRAHELTKPGAQLPAGWPGLLAALHAQAADSLQQGLALVRALPAADRRALRPLVALAHMHLALIDEVRTHGDRVLHERIMLTPLRKSWIALRASWGWLS
ncbi:squalene/phytoene synthase family protein [uncultured Aquabacterium sp.]|jgi:phytoene synthase|uniref:phytoene/squalene synthase family protein n=1 Tax=uncultured Aquabacterium sp. TaxID=158753 RepID=UPI002629F2AA|nr:squalene/phytoene synthase family protein [uncultured Aquabacterium sp.]